MTITKQKVSMRLAKALSVRQRHPVAPLLHASFANAEMPIGTRRDFSSAVVRSRRSVLATERDASGVDDPGMAVLVSRGVTRAAIPIGSSVFPPGARCG
jgi:hypothetical protein